MADVQPAGVEHTARRLTLAIDVGGTGLKASVVDEAAQMVTDRVRVTTPVGATPQQIVDVWPAWCAAGPFIACRSPFPASYAKGGC